VIELPDPPDGSYVTLERRDGGVEITWPAHTSGLGPALKALDVVILALAWPLAAVFIAAFALSLPIFVPGVAFGMSRAALLGALAGFFVALLFALAAFNFVLNRRRLRRPESLILTGQEIIYSSPHLESEAPEADDAPRRLLWPRGVVRNLRDLFRKRRRMFVRREAVRGVALLGREHFGSVVVKSDDGELEMARSLRGRDREWLAECLRLWLGP
jgi:hypothetical protein